jgi:GrpB-like predicted nucleotidyltransferase (UPF0157 family)
LAVAERELRAALAPFVLDIEHIGSTAVPGLAAKPLIDIQVGVRTLDDSPEIVTAMESLGYESYPSSRTSCPIAATSGAGPTGAVVTRSISSSAPTPTGGIDMSGFVTGFETTKMIGIGTRHSS